MRTSAVGKQDWILWREMKGHPMYSIFSCLLGNRTTRWLLSLVVMAITLTFLNGYLLYRSPQQAHTEEEEKENHVKTPTLWIYHDTDRPLHHVMTVFSRAGYDLNGGPGDKWDVLWSHKYPFKTLSPSLGARLRPHQRINHFPGSGCFVSKPSLASLPFPYIPKAFRLPQQGQQLRDEAAAHPEKLWVQKNNLHRGIKVKPIEKVNFDGGKFVQEFITNPLLFGGRKFDIGVYTAITSIDPLRVYTYHDEILLRFCSKDYRPFRASVPKQYVVDDEYTPVWEVPMLAEFYKDHKLSCKQTLNMALQSLGYEPRKVWDQVNNIIAEVLHHCHSNLIKQTSKFSSSPRHFFELVRFDFIIDDQLKVWLMEVNLSPNLSSGHTLGNRFMYEQVLFNLLSLVGATRKGGPDMQYNGEHESVMLVSERDIQLPLPQCWNGSCSSCSSTPPATYCQLCPLCQSPELSLVLKEAFLEHVESRNFHRLIPALSLGAPPTATPTDDLMHAWFAGKCKDDARWCN